MGFTPRQVGEMSLWQFSVAWSGYAAAQSGKEPVRQATEDEIAAAEALIDQGPQYSI